MTAEAVQDGVGETRALGVFGKRLYEYVDEPCLEKREEHTMMIDEDGDEADEFLVEDHGSLIRSSTATTRPSSRPSSPGPGYEFDAEAAKARLSEEAGKASPPPASPEPAATPSPTSFPKRARPATAHPHGRREREEARRRAEVEELLKAEERRRLYLDDDDERLEGYGHGRGAQQQQQHQWWQREAAYAEERRRQEELRRAELSAYRARLAEEEMVWPRRPMSSRGFYGGFRDPFNDGFSYGRRVPVGLGGGGLFGW